MWRFAILGAVLAAAAETNAQAEKGELTRPVEKLGTDVCRLYVVSRYACTLCKISCSAPVSAINISHADQSLKNQSCPKLSHVMNDMHQRACRYAGFCLWCKVRGRSGVEHEPLQNLVNMFECMTNGHRQYHIDCSLIVKPTVDFSKRTVRFFVTR
jgi:hypothetical protein